MHSRTLISITLLALCPLLVGAQTLTNELPPAGQNAATSSTPLQEDKRPEALPDDPGQEIPIAQPEPAPQAGVPVDWEAGRQSRVGDTWTRCPVTT